MSVVNLKTLKSNVHHFIEIPQNEKLKKKKTWKVSMRKGIENIMGGMK